MPIHEYTCSQCGHEFEELLRSAKQKVACPKCDSADVRKKLSAFSTVASASASPCGSADRCPQGSCCSGGTCPMHR